MKTAPRPAIAAHKPDLMASTCNSKRVLVWGALGFIGYHLTQALLDAGFPVSVLCRSRGAYSAPPWASRVQWHELDSGCTDTVLDAAVSSASIIVDLAGSSGAVASNMNPIESLDHNCRSQLDFLRACQRARHRPHVVFASSRLVYGQTDRCFISEDHPVSPRSVYAAHKLCIEHYMEVYACLDAITYTVCRISNAYGPDPGRAGQGYKILNLFILKSLAGLPITLFGDGEQIRDFIYIHDLTAMLIRCCVMPEAINETFNIGNGRGCRLVDAATLIRDLTHGPPLLFQPWPEDYLTVESGDYVSDISKTSQMLQFTPVYSVEMGIVSTLKEYRCERDAALADTGSPGSVHSPATAVAV